MAKDCCISKERLQALEWDVKVTVFDGSEETGFVSHMQKKTFNDRMLVSNPPFSYEEGRFSSRWCIIVD